MSKLEGRLAKIERDKFGDREANWIIFVPEGKEYREKVLEMFNDYRRRHIDVSFHPANWAPSQPQWVPVSLDDLSDEDLQSCIDGLDALISKHPDMIKAQDEQ